METEARRTHRSDVLAWLSLAAVLLLQGFLVRGTLALELVGHDTYPFIAAGKAESFGDIRRILGEEAMGGRYPAGRFYRPVTSLTFTLDHLLSGNAPSGYQRTNVAILLASTVLVFLLARRLIGGWIGPLAALLVQALHTAHLNTVPVTARRVETLFVLFGLAALVTVARPPPLRRWRCWVAASLALLAVGSKETGALVPPLIAGLVWARWPDGVPGRVRGAVRAAIPAALLVGVFLVLRQLVLGDFGGHPDTSLASLLSTPAVLWSLLEALLIAQPLLWAEHMGPAWTLAGVTLFAVALLPLVLASRRRAEAGRLVLLLFAMLLSLSALSAFSWRLSSWHIASALPAFALLVGIAARGAAEAWRMGGWDRRCAIASGASLALIVAAEISVSPLVRDYPEWRIVSDAQAQALARVRAAALELDLGESRDLGLIPTLIPRAEGEAGIEAAGVSSYTLEAYLELELPDVPVRVLIVPEGMALNQVPGERVLGVHEGAIGVRPARDSRTIHEASGAQPHE